MSTHVDVGGTKILIAELDGKGKTKRTKMFKTPSDYRDFIEKLSSELEAFDIEGETVIVAVPGLIDRKKGIALAFGNLDWKNVPISKDLEARLENTKIVIENDANLAGLGEYYALKKPPHQMLYITVSTGIGTGIVTDGRLDPDHLDSEGGQMLVEHQDKLQPWEKIASGKAIVAEFGKRAEDIDDPNIWNEVAERLSIGILNLLTILEPELIIIGGGVGTHFKKYSHVLHKQLLKHQSDMVRIPPIKQASQPEQAVILGCYQLLKQIS